MTRLIPCAFGIYFGLAFAADAADVGIGNPAFNTPNAPESSPGMPAPNVVNNDDRLFVRQLTIGGLAEVQLGELALSKGQSRMVQQFARQMVTDHQEGNRLLAALAARLGIPQPGQLDSDHRQIAARLETLNGAAFDLEYVRTQITDHQVTAHLLEWEIGSGENEQLRSFAADMLPRIMNHLQMARSIEDGLLGRMSDVVASRLGVQPR
jgi:putative membrane protein